MYGYIGVTDSNWFNFNKENNNQEVVFWKKGTRLVNTCEDQPFFFLVKGTKPRFIRGYGFVKESNIDSVENIWDKFGNKNGCNSLEFFESLLDKNKKEKIGYYLLKNTKYFKKGIEPNEINIQFPINTVSGKGIDYDESQLLLNEFGDDKKLSKIPNVINKHNYKYKTKKMVTNISENNLENIIEERLNLIEDGLKLIKRQYNVSPVGRIDLFCKDKNNDLVVIELKKYGVNNYSIIDQISRYMGFVKDNVAKENQKVRGIIIVGKIDESLKYSAKIIPNLEIKSFDLQIT
jgi:hypothetical protein